MIERLNEKSASQKRNLRIASEIRKALSYILKRENYYDNITFTITKVQLSVDMRFARIFCIPLGGIQRKKYLELLNKQKKSIRYALSSKIQLRYLPDLIFLEDKHFEFIDNMEKLLDHPHVKQDLSH